MLMRTLRIACSDYRAMSIALFYPLYPFFAVDQRLSQNSSRAAIVLRRKNSTVASSVLMREGGTTGSGLGTGGRISGIDTGGFVLVFDDDATIAFADKADPDAGLGWLRGWCWYHGYGVGAKLGRLWPLSWQLPAS